MNSSTKDIITYRSTDGFATKWQREKKKEREKERERDEKKMNPEIRTTHQP